jgi:hypothetical protein
VWTRYPKEFTSGEERTVEGRKVRVQGQVTMERVEK